MKFKVIRKQNNSSMCFVCGIDNQAGLHTRFYELDKNRLLGQFMGHDIHQSYPERMHGGIISSLLDETIGRSIQTIDDTVWGVTVDMHIKFLKPVPLDQELWAIGYITSNKRLLFEGEGYLCTPDQDILATCKAKYMKQSVNKIVEQQDFVKEQWIFVADDHMPEIFELPL